MSIEKKTGLFYELMIRGNWDLSNGRALGEIMTYQLTTGTVLIDTKTNTFANDYKPDKPRDLTKDEAIEFLGERFAGFLDQVTAERKRADDAIAAARKERDDAITKCNEAISQLDKLRSEAFPSTPIS